MGLGDASDKKLSKKAKKDTDKKKKKRNLLQEL